MSQDSKKASKLLFIDQVVLNVLLAFLMHLGLLLLDLHVCKLLHSFLSLVYLAFLLLVYHFLSQDYVLFDSNFVQDHGRLSIMFVFLLVQLLESQVVFLIMLELLFKHTLMVFLNLVFLFNLFQEVPFVLSVPLHELFI